MAIIVAMIRRLESELETELARRQLELCYTVASHDRYHSFADYVDAAAYSKELAELRYQLKVQEPL